MSQFILGSSYTHWKSSFHQRWYLNDIQFDEVISSQNSLLSFMMRKTLSRNFFLSLYLLCRSKPIISSWLIIYNLLSNYALLKKLKIFSLDINGHNFRDNQFLGVKNCLPFLRHFFFKLRQIGLCNVIRIWKISRDVKLLFNRHFAYI